MIAQQLSMFDNSPNELDWTFRGAPTREYTHCYHDYPARMIPQIAAQLLRLYAPQKGILFDPYCGTGTTLVEGILHGLSVIGTDLNPLTGLIARAKTSRSPLPIIDKTIQDFLRYLANEETMNFDIPTKIAGIHNLSYWFKPQVIRKLTFIKAFLASIENSLVYDFFAVAFSETVRESSNSRIDEFKIYRYPAAKVEVFNPDVLGLMTAKLQRNRNGLAQFLNITPIVLPSVQICEFNTVNEVPRFMLAPKTVDIVITSPPYGDSKTTVAYGQYSRFAAAWLDLEEPEKIDNKLLGSKTTKSIQVFCSTALNDALAQIQMRNYKRALEVSAFYSDLHKSILNVATTLKADGYVCYVVGNRRVNGILLPTDQVIQDFFASIGFRFITTYSRSIPNKRMPSRNSPSNVTGQQENTMSNEYIVVMQAPSN